MPSWKRSLTRLTTLALVPGALLLVPQLTPAAMAAEVLQDGGFEASSPSGDSPGWVEADSVFGTPICDAACSGPGARTGAWYAWFGGVATAGQTSSLSQTRTIPPGAATLSFWMLSGPTAPLTATLQVKVDATVVQTFTEPPASEGAYAQRTIDVSAFADGGSHTLTFAYANPDANTSNFFVDDVSLDVMPITATPTVTGAFPGGPTQSAITSVTGTAEAGSTVTLYDNASCTGGPLGSGPAADFTSTGITAAPPANTVTTIYAKATKAGQVASACSSSFATFTNDLVAPTPPSGLAVSPTSPGASTTPTLSGSAEANSLVAIYTNATCTGSPANTVAAETLSGGVPFTVAKGSTTKFATTATDLAGNVSACSSTVTYVQQDPVSPAPQTTLTKKPKKKVFTRKNQKKVTFAFTSSIAGSTFMCSIDGKAAKPCTSPLKFKAKLGKHRVTVTAVAAGVSDPTPVSYRFKVKKKPRT